MGVITLFVANSCPYCSKLKELLLSTMEDLQGELAKLENQADYRGVLLLEKNISTAHNGAGLLAQCQELSKSHTLPQVFFNRRHIGNAAQARQQLQAGNLRAQMLALALQPHLDLPPPRGQIIKVTSKYAAASQLSPDQLREIHQDMPEASVLSLVHPSEPSAVHCETALCAGLGIRWEHVPPHTAPERPLFHVQVDLVPKCSEQPPAAKRLPDLPELELTPATLATEPSSAAGTLDGDGEDAEDVDVPQRRDRAESLAAQSAADSEVSEIESLRMRPSLLGSPSIGSVAHASHVSGFTGVTSGSVWAMTDEDMSGTHPGQAVWTAEWLSKAVATLQSMPPPVIVHCVSGIAATAVVLAAVALERPGTTVHEVHRWAKAMRQHLEEHADLCLALSELLPSPVCSVGCEEESCEGAECTEEDAPADERTCDCEFNHDDDRDRSM